MSRPMSGFAAGSTSRPHAGMASAAFAIGLLVLLPVVPAVARQIDVIGPTYGISEPHLLRFIERQLREKEKSGELQRLIEAAQRRGVESIRSPAPVAAVRTATHGRVFHVDPSITLDRNITDAQGRLLFPAGTRRNPLEVVPLSQTLLFFDGRDPRQVEHASALMADTRKRVKPILTAGSYLALMKRWRRQVYFDQQGTLTRRLGIQQVPAMVTQDGMRLRIEEVVLP